MGRRPWPFGGTFDEIAGEVTADDYEELIGYMGTQEGKREVINFSAANYNISEGEPNICGLPNPMNELPEEEAEEVNSSYSGEPEDGLGPQATQGYSLTFSGFEEGSEVGYVPNLEEAFEEAGNDNPGEVARQAALCERKRLMVLEDYYGLRR